MTPSPSLPYESWESLENTSHWNNDADSHLILSASRHRTCACCVLVWGQLPSNINDALQNYKGFDTEGKIDEAGRVSQQTI
jgi:hypothetical protein